MTDNKKAERQQTEETLRRQNRELEQLNRANRAFSCSLDLDQELTTVLEEARHLLNVTSCSIWLIDRETDELVSRYTAAIVYIHLKLEASAERAFIDHTEAGGKLIPLHHSISSGKRKNAHWFKFLGIELPPGTLSQGGYQWIEPVTLDWVNLAPDHFITQHGVPYPGRLSYRSSEPPGDVAERPFCTLTESEVYLNHRFTEPRHGLVGLSL